MDDSVKYLIHADVTADGVVERNDVVGAVFGQTEGLLGDELDLRGLQESSKVGRIDVDVDSEQGQSYGHLTIESSLDKVATATLAAALETISRIGPCRARVEITEIEDVRAAKRRKVVERAKELLMDGFSDTVLSSEEILAEVRQQIRVEDITEYDGLPAGPRVEDSDAIIVVEGRADVLTLLQYGIKNAIAVEGTNVPDEVADLTRDRTVTVFLDGDRGGDLILEELSQVGEIDYVAFAPPGQSVEDLNRGEVFEALQGKVPYEAVRGMKAPREAIAATDGSATPAPPETGETESTAETTDDDRIARVEAAAEAAVAATESAEDDLAEASGAATNPDAETVPRTGEPPDGPAVDDPGVEGEADGDDDTDVESAGEGENDAADGDASDEAEPADRPPATLPEHVDEVVGGETGTVRLLDADFESIADGDADDAFDLLAEGEEAPTAVVLDGTLTQKILDVAAQRGVGQVVARDFGDFTKRPTGVRIRTADQLQVDS